MGIHIKDGLKELKSFFDLNLKIKEMLSSSAVVNSGYSDEYYATQGADKLIGSFETIEVYFTKMIGCFDLKDFKEEINRKFKDMKQKLLENSYNYESLKNSYKNIFADMRPEFVNEVNRNMVRLFSFEKK